MKVNFFVSLVLLLTLTSLAYGSLIDDSVATNSEAEEMAASQIESAINSGWPQTQNQLRIYCFNLGEGAAEAYFVRTTRGPNHILSWGITDKNISKIYEEIDELAQRFCGSTINEIFDHIQAGDWTDLNVKLIEKIYPLRTAFAQELLQPRSMTDDGDGCESHAAQPASFYFKFGASDILQYNAASFGDENRIITLENGNKQLSVVEYKHNFRYRFGTCN